ncbi:MAG TPA: helix-turn-helix transcriptional regulator [Planctomycetota bacterium]|nr:helix-turn-helix transcriptional regulator [Planctomycetota bacterium]
MARTFDDLAKRTTSKETRERGRQRARELLFEMLIGDLRKHMGKSQREVAHALGIRQPSLSKLENQSDMQISTLQRIVSALGVELDVIARFPKVTVRIDQFNDVKSARHRKRKAS